MRPVSLVLSCCWLLLLGSNARARDPGGDTCDPRFHVSAERLAAFRRTLREFGGSLSADETAAWGLHLEARYVAPPFLPIRAGDEAGDDLRIPPGVQGRDVIAEERFLIEGREDDFEDAAQKWMARRLKGSDAAGKARGNGFSPKFAWDGGPVVGVRRGPVSAELGEDQWGIRFTRRLKSKPGWVMRAGISSEDSEERVSFSLGRSLFHALRR